MESLPPELHEGEYVRCPTSGVIYRIVKSYRKRRFPSDEFYSQVGSPVYKEVNCEMLENIPDGPEYTLEEKKQITEFVYEYPEGVKEGDVVYCRETGNRYLVANKTKRKFPNTSLYEKFGSPKVNELPCDIIKGIPDGPPLTEDDVPVPWYDTFMGGTLSSLFKKREEFKGDDETQLKGKSPNCVARIADAFIRAIFVGVIGVLFFMINNKPISKEYISLLVAVTFVISFLLV